MGIKPYGKNYRDQCPEFDAHELNLLTQWGRRDISYLNAKELYLATCTISEKQKNWLWAIKRELQEACG